MRSFDVFVALKVCPLDSFRPVAMHDAIDHHMGARQIRDRFKDGLIFQHCENAREIEFQNCREAVVDVKGNTSLVELPSTTRHIRQPWRPCALSGRRRMVAESSPRS